MFKGVFIIYVFLVLISCSVNDDNKRFEVLNKMFNTWYSTNTQEQGLYYFKDTNSKNDFLLDLERFKFELSQINESKIYNSNKNQFRNMNYKIDKILINNKFIDNDFDPSRLFKYIYIKLNSYQCSGEYFDIDEVLDLLNKYKKKYKYVYPGVLNQIEIYVNKINFLIDSLNNSQNKNIELNKINKLRDVCNKLYSWSIEELIIDEKQFNLDKKKIYNKRTEIFSIYMESFDYNQTMSFVNNDILESHNQIFNIIYPRYLRDNDEPIWVDRQDTISVIKNVIDRKYLESGADSEIDITNIFNFKEPVKDYLIGNHILSAPNYFCNKDVSLLAAYSLNDTISLEKNKNKSFSNSYKTIFDYFSPEISNLPSINKTKFELLLFFENVWFDLNFSYSDDFNQDQIESSIYSIKNLFFKILSEQVFSYKSYQVNLIYNLNKLRFFINVVLKDKYINNNISKEKAIEYLISQGFYSNKEAEKIWQEIIFPNNYYLDKYLASLKLNQLYEQNCIIKNNSINDFFNKTKKIGFVPFLFFEENY